MLDMSWGEVMVIGAVALIVIGPKDLPKALRTVGQMTAKVRRMAGEFQSQFNDAMREAELDDVRRQMQDLNHSVASATPTFNPIQTVRDELKGAVEKPVTADPPSTPAPDQSPTEALATATAQGRGEAASPVPVEPSLALPVPSVPPIVDPAHSVATTVEQAARKPEAKSPSDQTS